jgi:hypothetical protein
MPPQGHVRDRATISASGALRRMRAFRSESIQLREELTDLMWNLRLSPRLPSPSKQKLPLEQQPPVEHQVTPWLQQPPLQLT